MLKMMTKEEKEYQIDTEKKSELIKGSKRYRGKLHAQKKERKNRFKKIDSEKRDLPTQKK